uniref:Uncharacterized protein n=1 Tax=Peronospora matthiolae TaxID=2874970 RepID=A0AAV1U015_9STRA
MLWLFESGNWNENNLNPLTRINWRASLVEFVTLYFLRHLPDGLLVEGMVIQLFTRYQFRFRPPGGFEPAISDLEVSLLRHYTRGPPLEGKSGASSRGNSSSNSVY